jgi:IS6 family transposase
VLAYAVRCYPRFGLWYRDAEELLADRGIEVDRVIVDGRVAWFTPLLADAAHPCRHRGGIVGRLTRRR